MVLFIKCALSSTQLARHYNEEPAIRANTTILLGNVARFLAEATAKRVLLNAFTRALRDQFPPARMVRTDASPPKCSIQHAPPHTTPIFSRRAEPPNEKSRL